MKKRILLLLSCLLALCCLLGGCGEENVPIDPPDGGLLLDKTELTLWSGEEATLTVSFEGGKKIKWESSDESVVSIRTDGATVGVKGLEAGTATVTASCDDLSATCTVTVKASTLSVFLPDGATGSLKNGRLVLIKNGKATVKALSDVPLKGEPKWTSSDESIGKVEYQGLICIVTAVNRGECTITVECDGMRTSFLLLVGKNA